MSINAVGSDPSNPEPKSSRVIDHSSIIPTDEPVLATPAPIHQAPSREDSGDRRSSPDVHYAYPIPPPPLESTQTDPEDDGDDLTLTRESLRHDGIDMKERDFAQPSAFSGASSARHVTFSDDIDAPPLFMIDQLVEMGFHRAKVITALRATNSLSVEGAMNWLFENDTNPMEAPAPDDPLYAPMIRDGTMDESHVQRGNLEPGLINQILSGGNYNDGEPPVQGPDMYGNQSAIGSMVDPLPPARAPSPVDDAQKMVFIVRTDLAMGKGKIAAQCAHGAVELTVRATQSNPASFSRWLETGATKIVLKCETERELIDLEENAMRNGVAAYSVHDAGRTQVAAGTRTVLALGPASLSRMDSITGELKLL